FTYVDDIVAGVAKVLDHPPERGAEVALATPAGSTAPYRIYNIGNNEPVELMRYIEVMQAALGKRAILDRQPMQQGDVVATAADLTDLSGIIGFKPATSIEEGVPRFVQWYRDYYRA
ncbi:MAG: capsular biosynthesis protein CpsI, partial [Burkholderiales bacterium]